MRPLNYMLLLLLLYTGGVFFLYQLHADREQQYLSHTSTLLDTTYQASLERYALAMDTFYTSVTHHPEAIPLFFRGIRSTGAQQEELRSQLYTLLQPQFRDLIVRGIQQWQFHRADGSSYLRMHAPAIHDDNLLALRPSLQQTRIQPIPRYGFEAGRLFIGFRFIHPMFEQGSLMGSMETGISLHEISLDLAALAPDQAFLFLLKRETVEALNLFDSTQFYEPSLISSQYLLDHRSLAYQQATTLPLHDLRMKLASESLDATLAQGKPFSLALFHQGQGYSATFIPVRNFRNETDGYILALHSAPILSSIQWDFYSSTAIGLVIICLLGWLVLNLHRQRQLTLSQVQRLDSIGQAVGEGIYVLDRQGRTLYVNEAATRLTGFNAEKLHQSDLHNLLHSHEDNNQMKLAECPIFVNALNGGTYDADEEFRTRTGQLIPVVVTSRPLMEDGQVNGVVTVFRDISERKEQEQRLQELATTDPLTGLNNRRAFMERLSEELQLHHRLQYSSSLLMVDFDHFKEINDQYGHQAGDQVLKHFAQVARDCLRQTDLLGRLGGEEFAILLPGTELKGAIHLAELLRERMESSPTTVENGEIPMTLSIGVTTLCVEDKDPSDVLNRADRALYQAKDQGRNQYVAA